MDMRIYSFGGLGGLVCGIDFGIIAVAVPYIRALQLYTDLQLGWIVGGVMLGGIVASACGGHLCDKLGRRATIRLATLCFLVSIPVICLSGASFPVIMAGLIIVIIYEMIQSVLRRSTIAAMDPLLNSQNLRN